MTDRLKFCVACEAVIPWAATQCEHCGAEQKEERKGFSLEGEAEEQVRRAETRPLGSAAQPEPEPEPEPDIELEPPPESRDDVLDAMMEEGTRVGDTVQIKRKHFDAVAAAKGAAPVQEDGPTGGDDRRPRIGERQLLWAILVLLLVLVGLQLYGQSQRSSHYDKVRALRMLQYEYKRKFEAHPASYGPKMDSLARELTELGEKP